MENAPKMLHPDVKSNLYQLHKSDGKWDIPSLATKFKLKEAR
jgi:hypothetical protein